MLMQQSRGKGLRVSPIPGGRVFMGVRMLPELRLALSELAQELGLLSDSQVIEYLIAQAVAEHKARVEVGAIEKKQGI